MNKTVFAAKATFVYGLFVMRLSISTVTFASGEKNNFIKRPQNVFCSLQKQEHWPLKPPVTKYLFSVGGNSFNQWNL